MCLAYWNSVTSTGCATAVIQGVEPLVEESSISHLEGVHYNIASIESKKQRDGRSWRSPLGEHRGHPWSRRLCLTLTSLRGDLLLNCSFTSELALILVRVVCLLVTAIRRRWGGWVGLSALPTELMPFICHQNERPCLGRSNRMFTLDREGDGRGGGVSRWNFPGNHDLLQCWRLIKNCLTVLAKVDTLLKCFGCRNCDALLKSSVFSFSVCSNRMRFCKP